MRAYDFSPFARSSVGFERLFELLNNQREERPEGYPPYDIIRTGEDTFCISLAVSGFKAENLSVTAQQNLLVVAGQRPEGGEPQYIYQGISARPFERRFDLADYVEVEGASLENGLLQIVLTRRVPDAMKPRRVAIGPSNRAKLGVAS